jgi:membrane-associated phospholipid phosphatase
MNPAVPIALSAGCLASFALERRGVLKALALEFKGDVKRETRWLAQYGQSACTPVVALLVWDFGLPRQAVLILLAVGATSLLCAVLKRLFGRVRPGRENAGRFLGPSWRHANYREAFPSSHGACAVALSTVLAALFPGGANVFWGLAVACAALRYLLDAHWLSDVLAGCTIGYLVAHAAIALFPVWR